jgi:hypothetical protein
VYDDAVAPLMAVPFFFHWYVRVPVPVAATMKVAVCPAVMDWLAGWVVIESTVVPVPLRETESGEFSASLATAMLPVTFPAACGANWTWNAWFCPAAIETEDIPPTTLKPAPVIIACEIVTAAVPVFVTVRVWELLEPVVTFPKLRLVALAASDPEEVVLEFDFAAGVPAPVSPTQPERDNVARKARKIANNVSGVPWFDSRLLRAWTFVCEFTTDTV